MTTTVGFIGVGNMGSAIIRGLAGRKGVEVHGVDLDKAKLKTLQKDCGLVPQASVKALVSACDYVILAVKPQHAAEAMKQAAPSLTKGRCLVSIAAGLTRDKLKKMSGGKCPVVRVMPNTPALVGAGVFALCLDDPALREAAREFVAGLFAKLGQTYVLEEKFFDAFTGLAGSGPAYVLYFMEALIESGVLMGLPRDKATDITLGLFAGTSKLASEAGQHPSVLREMVTSPAGTTIEALMHLDRQAVRAAIIDAAVASRDRSKALGG
jgi:pyrroline-5-carboxylate reductase